MQCLHKGETLHYRYATRVTSEKLAIQDNNIEIISKFE